MQLVKTSRDNLLRPLQIVSGIVERRHTLPILANLLIRKSGSNVSFLSTDIEIQITTHAECGVALVGRAQQEAFVTRVVALGAAPRPVGLVEGRNYSNGRRLALTLYVLDGEPGR